MALKIKWNDDRVRGATTAVLLLARERIARGASGNLVQACLADYRADPEGYKQRKAAWADAKELGPLTKPAHIAHYRNLGAAVEALLRKLTQAKRQFNSLLELDNCLIANLRDGR